MPLSLWRPGDCPFPDSEGPLSFLGQFPWLLLLRALAPELLLCWAGALPLALPQLHLLYTLLALKVSIQL